MKNFAKYKILNSNKGFSLMELIVVIIIIGVLSAVGVRSIMKGNENARVQETMREMEAIKDAVIGDPDLVSNGVRTDFGFVGDCGAWPTSPQDLITNPGYAFWNGPYISTGFQENPDDFIQDAWGNPYSFTQTTVQSSGGGSGTLTKTIVDNIADALNNTIIGNIVDWNGSVPMTSDLPNFKVGVMLQSGGGILGTIQLGGIFTISGVHIGNHTVMALYTGVAGVDTIKKLVSVDLKSVTRVDLRFPVTFKGTGAGGGGGGGSLTQADYLEVTGSNVINNNFHADGIRLTNTSLDYNVTIESIDVSWSSASSKERYVQINIDGNVAYPYTWPGEKSGSTASLPTPFNINSGETNLVYEMWWNNTGDDPIGKSLTLVFHLSDGSIEAYP